MSIDTRLLNIFDAIFKHRSVSRASEELGIGQPTVSIGLNKLREHYHDPLFIRVGNEMQPTDLSVNLSKGVQSVLAQIQSINDFNMEFDPKTSNQQFNISMTDISHLVLLPKLINYLQIHSPNIRINIIPIDNNTQRLMESGDIDLAIGFLPQLEAGFYQQTLFKQHYVVIANTEHPRLQREQITVDEYRQELHVDILATGGHYVVEHELQKLNIKRNTLVTLPSYLGIGLVIQETNAIATIPNYLSHVLLSRGGLKIMDLPFNLPKYEVKQHWHSLVNNNPSNQWLRRICFSLFSGTNI